ncbi:MAG: hypothetical protein EAY75_10215 [Bacteroidetes bacterium]|nr:MAG: hypothetical protein EAY75_10215 [Bacteroidota bacterium]
MNVLIITLGTSDVQITLQAEHGFFIEENLLKKDGLQPVHLRSNRNYSDPYLLQSPRRDGEVISENYDDFKVVLDFPLIKPLLNFLEKNNASFHEVWWVYTDQQNEKEHFKAGDTLFYKTILQSYFEERYPSLTYQNYAIHDRVKDVDEQYRRFYKIALSLVDRKAEIENIFLLPQGGIDQINHALTLQLIQMFKSKVKVFQNAELSETVQLQFPNLFLSDLTKNNVIKHIRDYDFDKAAELIFENDELREMANYANLRLNLLHPKTENCAITDALKLNWENLDRIQQQQTKIQDLTYAFKIQMKQGKYNDALTKLFTISENMFKHKLDEYTQDDAAACYNKKLRDKEDVNENWESFITQKLGDNYVAQLKDNEIHVNNPNLLAYCYLYRWIIADGKAESSMNDDSIKKLNTIINDLRDKRNNIAHHLGAITFEEINTVFIKRKTTADDFYQLLDKMVGTSGFGIYATIQKKILAHYGESV